MSYTHRSRLIKTYIPSDDIIAANDDIKAVPSGGTWNMVKEIRLDATVSPYSLFRFKFSGAETGGGANKAQIYRNGVAVGTESPNFPGGGGYTEYTEDIAISDWQIGDLVQLYAYATNAGCNVKNFRICGIGSDWYNTLK